MTIYLVLLFLHFIEPSGFSIYLCIVTSCVCQADFIRFSQENGRTDVDHTLSRYIDAYKQYKTTIRDLQTK